MKNPNPKQDPSTNAAQLPTVKPSQPAAPKSALPAPSPPSAAPKPALPTPKPPMRPAAAPTSGRPPLQAAPAKSPSVLKPAGARGPARPAAANATGKPVNGTPLEMVHYLSGQIQILATRLESLREQGAGQTTEFRQLEQMLAVVQDKLVLAQGRIERNSH